jgi:hypothetical protein
LFSWRVSPKLALTATPHSHSGRPLSGNPILVHEWPPAPPNERCRGPMPSSIATSSCHAPTRGSAFASSSAVPHPQRAAMLFIPLANLPGRSPLRSPISPQPIEGIHRALRYPELRVSKRSIQMASTHSMAITLNHSFTRVVDGSCRELRRNRGHRTERARIGLIAMKKGVQ